jgi:2-keto-myo-inositol isomerase
MHPTGPTRREWLAASAALGLGLSGRAEEKTTLPEPFGYCFNTSTIREQKLTIVQEAEFVSRAGYQGIEPWLRELDQYVKDGGSLKDLGKRFRDLGLSVEDVIAFPEWVVDDEAKRAKGLEEVRRAMDVAARIGGKRIACPPAGAVQQANLSLSVIAERYRAVLEIGGRMGVVPQVEVWGFSRTLGKLSEAAHVALEAKHPKACILPDVYHLYKGGSGYAGLRLLSGQAIQMIHMNDYPAQPPRDEITDAARVLPGEGVAPLKEILRDMYRAGFRGMLSLELFNRELWKADPLHVARLGIEKMKAVVRSALDGIEKQEGRTGRMP